MSKLVIRLGLVGIGALLAVLLAEGVLRLLHPRLIGSYKGLYTVSLDVGYKMKPNLNVEYMTPEYTTLVRSNSLGFRDREPVAEKPEGTFRILVLGDSVVEALQVPLEATFHKLLEERLNATGSQPRYEILAMGVGGSNLIREFAVWERYGRRFHPDLVLLVTVPNDVEGSLAELPSVISEESLDALQQRLPVELHSSLVAHFYRSLHLYYFVRNSLWRLRGGDKIFYNVRAKLLPLIGIHELPTEPSPWLNLAATGTLPPSQQRSWEGFLRVFEVLSHDVQGEEGTRFAVMIAPLADQFEPRRMTQALKDWWEDLSTADPDRFDTLLGQFLASRGIPYLALGSRFRETQKEHPSQALAFPYDPHWTSLGHRLAADALFEWLSSANDLLGAPSGVAMTSGEHSSSL